MLKHTLIILAIFMAGCSHAPELRGTIVHDGTVLIKTTCHVIEKYYDVESGGVEYGTFLWDCYKAESSLGGD